MCQSAETAANVCVAEIALLFISQVAIVPLLLRQMMSSLLSPLVSPTPARCQSSGALAKSCVESTWAPFMCQVPHGAIVVASQNGVLEVAVEIGNAPCPFCGAAASCQSPLGPETIADRPQVPTRPRLTAVREAEMAQNGTRATVPGASRWWARSKAARPHCSK